jgi:uroporphyrinogen decarboxylase
MFRVASSYPVQVINWHDQETEPDLAMGKSMFSGAVCGGLSRWQHVHYGTPTTIRDQVRQAISQVASRRLIVSTGCVTMITSPWSNIRAVRESVESAGV